MNSLKFSILIIIYGIWLPAITESNKFPDAIELVGYNSRHARMPKDLMRTTYVQPSMKKQRADIETVKQNIEEYNKLLKIDTKKLSDQQKDMLERIVERVARLKETLEIDAAAAAALKSATDITDGIDMSTLMSTAGTTPKSSSSTNSLSDDIIMSTTVEENASTLNVDDESSSAPIIGTVDDNDSTSLKFISDETTFVPPSTENDARAALTTILEPSDEARANTKIDSTSDGELKLSTISGIRASTTSNKHKTRQSSSTKRPSSSTSAGTKTTSKRISTTTNQHHLHHHSRQPSVKPTVSAATYSSLSGGGGGAISTNTVTSTQQPASTLDFSTVTTLQTPTMKNTNFVAANTDRYDDTDDSLNLKIQQTQQPDNNDEIPESKTVLNIDHHLQPVVQIQERTPINSGGIIASDLIYDANVTATSIIDSLSNHAREDYYSNKGSTHTDTIKDKKPASGTAKPTKYHYYPHNQHIYLLPECAIQQVCNAVYVRLNYTQPLCACPSRYRDPCSASLNEDDQHTTKLIGDGKKKAITLAKTCEATTEMRECRSPKDWSLLALQNTRTGKSHYLVICRCPDHFKLEGPMAHDQPTYASVPGIRVFGMMCVKPGYAVRKPSVQPPKRYQLHKPYYISNNNKYSGLNKDSRPSLGSSSNNGYQQHHQQQQQQDSYQLQHQANYQYLNRPESSPIITSASHTEYPDSISINTFNNGNSGGGGYGRNNERKGEIPIEAVAEEKSNDDHNNDDDNNNDNQGTIDTNNNNSNNKREKRSTNDNVIPEFPWDKLVEFQKSVVWDD